MLCGVAIVFKRGDWYLLENTWCSYVIIVKNPKLVERHDGNKGIWCRGFPITHDVLTPIGTGGDFRDGWLIIGDKDQLTPITKQVARIMRSSHSV